MRVSGRREAEMLRGLGAEGREAEIKQRWAEKRRDRIALLLAAGCDRDLRGWVVGGAVPLVDKCGDGLS